MAVFSGTVGVYARETTARLGIGASVNAGTGAFVANTGVEIIYSTVNPNGVVTARAGSLVLRSNGDVYVNTSGGTVWIVLGGTTTGWNLLNDVVGTWGTTSPDQFESVYVSASTRFDLRGRAIAAAVADVGVALRIATGSNTITGAAAGGVSGAISIFSGATDSTDAGGTGGDTGAVALTSGNANSTLGTSGSTGNVSLASGDSADANSGNVVLSTGTAAGVRGVLDVNVATIDTVTQAVQWQLIDASASSLQIGAAGALTMLVFDTSNGAEEIVVNAVGGFRAANDIPFEVGSAANDLFGLVYSLGSNEARLRGAAISAGGATQNTRPLVIATGARTLTDAAGSSASGALTIASGAIVVSTAGGGATGGASGALVIGSGTSDVTVAANTGGPTGAVTVETGATSSTAGTSGASGILTIRTGASEDAATGALAIRTGNAAAAGAVVSGALTIASGTVGGTGTTGDVTISTGAAAGAGVSGSIALTPGTTVGGVRGTVTATGFRTASDSAAAIVGARVLTLADAGGVFSVSQGAAYDIDLPSPTSGPGCRYLFYLTGPAANNVTITVLGGAATFVGTIVNDVTSVIPATGSTLTFATGAAALGDTIEIVSISTTLYLVRAVTSAAGGILIA